MAAEERRTFTTEDVDREFPLKVELHVHLEGAVRFDTILDLARKQKLDLPESDVEGLKRQVCVYKAEDLTSALENLFLFAPTFAGHHEGVYRISVEFCEDVARQGVAYAELRYSPHFLCNSLHVRTYARDQGGSYTPRDVVRSVNQGLEEGRRQYGVVVNTILCCIRHIPEWSMEVVELCSEFSQQGVVAMDIAGPEMGDIVTSTDQSLHLAAFQEARKRGIHCTAHAGEVAPAEKVHMDGEGRCQFLHQFGRPHVVRHHAHTRLCLYPQLGAGETAARQVYIQRRQVQFCQRGHEGGITVQADYRVWRSQPVTE